MTTTAAHVYTGNDGTQLWRVEVSRDFQPTIPRDLHPMGVTVWVPEGARTMPQPVIDEGRRAALAAYEAERQSA